MNGMEVVEFREAVALAIRALRAERGWSQRELCRRTGLSPAYLSELEAAQKDASLDVLTRIATALGVQYDQFLWSVLLAMQTSEVPGAHRRETALHLARRALAASPASRAELEQYLEFLDWRDRSGRRRGEQEIIDDTEPAQRNVTEG
jgi:transcriptional regulator with XRE-family HTH domain